MKAQLHKDILYTLINNISYGSIQYDKYKLPYYEIDNQVIVYYSFDDTCFVKLTHSLRGIPDVLLDNVLTETQYILDYLNANYPVLPM